MRRIIALILALSMMFALCACGGSEELSDEEKEKIYQEVAREKAKSEQAAAEKSKYEGLTESMLGEQAVSYMAEYPTESDYVSIEGIKLVPADDGKYIPDVLIKNLYEERIPDTINVYCNYINSKGEVVEQVVVALGRIAYNQSMWSSAASSKFTAFDLSEITEIQFANYEILCILSAQDIWYQNFAFVSPISYKTADIEIEY